MIAAMFAGADDLVSIGSVNLMVYRHLEACLSDPGGGVTLDCRCFDVDRDNDVDLPEVALFQRSFTGG